ncbi:MAG: carboxypeptidase-like regulatory domain-containing protein, partial [Bacteroidota bacterium]|nr:carboxypeptidase-like regulatory domain-containing protein [Bacteroidota bacterium]
MKSRTLIFLIIFPFLHSHAQKSGAVVSGKVLDENEKPLVGVSITMLGRETGLISSDSGTFRMHVPADKAFAIVFSYTGYKNKQQNFILNDKEEERIVILMERSESKLQNITVTEERNRKEAGLIRINPKDAINMPTPVGGIESIIKVYVGSSNELTSQYSVRGGNYDENLIYINDYEIFRPYLVSNAQQEGLSFINPEMTRNVNFYNGGFQARYGDKISSVLDIQYKKPVETSGSAYVGLLEQGLELEGTSKNTKLSYIIGARNKSFSTILNSQETKGNYIPSSADVQGLFTYQFNQKNSLELFTTYSETSFDLVPQSAQLSTAVFSPYFTADLGLDIFFNGQEKDKYKTSLFGLTWIQQINSNLKLKWMLSSFSDIESQNYNITGNYLFGERNFDKSSPDFGKIVNPLGIGSNQNFARDNLNIHLYSLEHKGYLTKENQYFQWGITADLQTIKDDLHEWIYEDSAGYSLPYQPGSLNLNNVVNGNNNLRIGRFTGFLQDNISFKRNSAFTLQGGGRFNYNTFTRQLLLSPRIGISWKPVNSRKDIVYKAAAGMYVQPPFYRELRAPDGVINPTVKAEQSFQITAGFDINFHQSEKPFRLSVEAYYKDLWNVNPYNINNVNIQYFATNDAKAYAVGVESRLFANLVKDAESWISIGIMQTKEKISGASYYDYLIDSLNKPTDSSLVQQGWIRRPTDRLFTMGMFIQDYLSTDKNFKVYLNLIYGTNLPYSVPGSVKYRNALIIEPY